jgi:peptide/nickel transport system substrate-binding protein
MFTKMASRLRLRSDDVWETGFLAGPYNQTARQTIANPGSKSEYDQREVWARGGGSTVVTTCALVSAGLAPIFFVGWHEDFHDPHNWYVPYLVTTYAARQNVPAEIKDTFVPFINEGVLLSDPEERNAVYRQLNQAVYDNPVGVILAIGTLMASWRYVQAKLTVLPGATSIAIRCGKNRLLV